ncbi:MAG: hypothetical protein H6779_02015 [Candidatus Nomurabacteria bacterium]|nr:hypothetical protein [Candidatus Nomurabacteria bacterium]USN88200.1 MAG: hypothetical protein H6779_02015 [Candidatus Nomurabacteria bacterium]
MRILVFGDSNTFGYHDGEAGGWCNRLSLLAHKKIVDSDYEYSTSVFNLGISGDNSQDLRERIEVELKARLTDQDGAVLLAIGVNDSQYEIKTNKNRVSTEDFEKNLIFCIEEAKKYTAKIFLLTILPVNEELLSPMPWKPTHAYSQDYIDKYNEVIKLVAEKQSVKVIDVSNVLVDSFKDYFTDGIHPNAEGHRLVYERVKEVLEEEKII